MKKLLRKIDWWIDIYILWIFYSPKKYDRYINYLEKKWKKDGN